MFQYRYQTDEEGRRRKDYAKSKEKYFQGHCEPSDLPCPICNCEMVHDCWGGFYLKCTNCGHVTW